jgi:predicted nucleic acid-binding protein
MGYPKFRLSDTEQQELLADYVPYCKTLRMPAKPPETPVGRDPFDIPFLQLAILSKADYLVTGDKDLPSLADSSPCPIITADRLLEMLSHA